MALTHSLAVSMGPAVRVNCVSPGWLDVSGAEFVVDGGMTRKMIYI